VNRYNSGNMENKAVNYIDFYDAEKLLFEKVGPEFRP
jgi:hypothetical protein